MASGPRTTRSWLAAALLGALVVAGCSTEVTGTGRGSAPPPVTSASSRPTTSAAPTPTSAAPTSTTPTNTTPTSTAPTGSYYPQALLRERVTTAVGDPVIANYCATLGTALFRPLGYRVDLGSLQFLSGCVWRLTSGGSSQLDVTIFAAPISTLTARPRTSYRTVNGLKVRVSPRDSVGTCLRDVLLTAGTPTALTVDAFPVLLSKTSPKMCRAADLAVAGLTAKVRAKAFRPMQMAHNSVTQLDMCKVAEVAGLAASPLLAGSSPARRYFGAECLLRGAKVTAYIDTAISDPARAQTGKPVRAGAHTVLPSKSNEATDCVFTSRQGRLPGSGAVEEIQFQFVSNSVKAVPGMCSTAQAVMAKFLDTARLP